MPRFAHYPINSRGAGFRRGRYSWSFQSLAGSAGSVGAVMVGHTPQRQPTVLGNVYHIDTAGWGSGHFTLVELGTLSLTPPQA